MMLRDKVAIVTGSTRGNGQAIANLLSEHGAKIVVAGRDGKEAKAVADILKKTHGNDTFGLGIDISSTKDVKTMINKTKKKFGKIDILVNNAGYPIEDRFWESAFHKISDEDLEKVLNIDTKGTYRCCREVIPIMIRQKSGVIVNISSTPAVVGYDKGAPYTVAKAANLGITKHIAKEYGKYGIRCNAIAPGTIATKRNWDRLSVKEKKELVSSIPLGRSGEPEDIAGVVLMLVSDFTSFVNGQTIIVDGGEAAV